MRLETFRGRSLQSMADAAQHALGEDAVIVSTRVLRDGGSTLVEVVAASAADVETLRQKLEPGPLPVAPEARKGRPLVIALVGPAGSGKTTTLAKLAANPRAFRHFRVGVLTLDVVRAGASEQLRELAFRAGFALESASRPEELRSALRRLGKCDVLLLDTPGRLPCRTASDSNWLTLLDTPGRAPLGPDVDPDWPALLEQVRPDEVHLVLPASMRPDIARSIRDRFVSLGATHVLFSRLDEVPGEQGLTELAAILELPARWVTDGPDLVGGLHGAPTRLLSALASESRSGSLLGRVA